MRYLVVSLGCLLIMASTESSDAQRLQPRCQGWPASTGKFARTGTLVGVPGRACYGSVLVGIRTDCALLGAQVAVPPRQGAFRLIGLQEFEYVPQPGMHGADRIEVLLNWECSGKRSSNRAILRAMTQDEYLASGGTASRPPN